MKIYIPSLFAKQTIKLDKIKKFLTKRSIINYIFTKNGIYQIYKNKLMQLDVIDIPCKEFKIDTIEFMFIIDYSNFKFCEESMQLPVDHTVENIISYEYSLRPGGQVHFVVEYNEQEQDQDDSQNTNKNTNTNKNKNTKEMPIKDFYFLANDDINTQILIDDILSFLEQLNLC